MSEARIFEGGAAKESDTTGVKAQTWRQQSVLGLVGRFRVAIVIALALALTFVFALALAGLLSGFYSSATLTVLVLLYIGLLGLLLAAGLRYRR
jgi:hypothetical protein